MAKTKRPKDINLNAKYIVDLLTGEKVVPDLLKGKNSKAVKSGQLGGAKGGVARAKKLSSKQKTEIAKKAAATQWAKNK